MPKYSSKFKLEEEKYCIEGHNIFKLNAEYYNTVAKITLQKWCRKYQIYEEK